MAPTAASRASRVLRVVAGAAMLAMAALSLEGRAIGPVGVPYFTDYYGYHPGSAREVDPAIEVPADRDHPVDGRLWLLTVSLRRETTISALFGWHDRDVDVYHRSRIFGPAVSDQQNRDENLADMDNSKQVAEVVAFRAAGFEVVKGGRGALVLKVRPGSPAADGGIRSGDVIVEAAGQPVRAAADVLTVLEGLGAGDSLTLAVTAGGDDRRRTVTVRLAAGTVRLGVGLADDHPYDLPFEVEIDSGVVGGPSAGLAYTLGLYDRLTEGSLTKGHRVAVTGTMALDGRVGPVGGVAQKTVAAREAGADLFLVPPAEAALARSRAGDMRVVEVSTVDDAIRALAALPAA